ncbi:MAG: VWA domain-containing protein [Polyangiaceae bacterium]|jgi:Ca-activated chloride channel family protein|nr:VWA domain-containing protein [Polyangiaceae bacterium]
MQAMLPALFPAPSSSSGVRLVASDGREAAFQGATLHVRAQGGLAVVVLTQRFRNDHAEPLSVRYTMPLPANAAVRGYSFLLGGKLIRGEVDRKQQARERFEQAIAAGQTAGIVDQERSSVFTQELGNIPPGEEIVALLELDQRLEWLDDGRWSWRFPTVVAPRYLGAAGRTPDPEKVTVDLREQPLPTPPRVELILHLLDPLQGPVDSPTHPLTTHPAEATEVRLAQHALLDRDIAVRWPVALPRVGLSLQLARPEATHPAAASSFGLLSVLPPAPSSRLRPLPRDLIFLLDASGSMYGDPIQKSKRLMRALIETLEGDDQLELICFGDMPHRWKRGPVKATREARKEALAWVDRLQAEGGTEMKSGILEALAPLRPGAQRQVVLITDGLIGFESEIVATIHDRLPPGCRVHTVGVGSSINRSLTGPAARAGHGVEILLDLDGDEQEATRQLLARTCAPQVTQLSLGGDALLDHAPACLPDLFAGAPALLSLRLRPEGGLLLLQGQTADGPWSAELQVPPQHHGEGSPSLPALHARERVEDLEALWARGQDQRALDRQIEQIGLDFQISTRLTSWVAITEQRTVSPGANNRKENVSQEIPYGMSAAQLGLRAASGAGLAQDREEREVLSTGAYPVLQQADDDDRAKAREFVLPSKSLASPQFQGRRQESMSSPAPIRITVPPSASRPAPGGLEPQPMRPYATRRAGGWWAVLVLLLLLVPALVYWFFLRR